VTTTEGVPGPRAWSRHGHDGGFEDLHTSHSGVARHVLEPAERLVEGLDVGKDTPATTDFYGMQEFGLRASSTVRRRMSVRSAAEMYPATVIATAFRSLRIENSMLIGVLLVQGFRADRPQSCKE
jgi:hypothetical protein